MVVGIELALVLRRKGGRAFLTQSRSIDHKAATDATWEVANALAHHSSAKGREDAEQSGDTLPGYTGGDMPASNGRFRVVYRLAGKVYVMAVAPAHSNVFFATRIVNAAVHYLVYINKGINITAEKIASRFPDVYLALAELIANGGNREQAVADSESASDSLSSDAAKTVKALRKSFTTGLTNRKSSTTTAKSVLSTAALAFVGNRTLTEEVDPLTQAAFEMPADALPPLQYVPPEQVLAASRRSWGGFEGYRLMPLDPVAAAAEEAALAEQAEAQKKGDWKDQAPGAEPAPEAPPFSALDDISFPEATGPKGLWLEETWRCHVVGSKPIRMGTRGRVLGTSPATRDHLHTIFRVQPPEAAARPLAAAVHAGKANREIAVSGEELAENVFVAYFDRIFGRTEPAFLEYQLPGIAIPAPLQVRFLAFLAEPEDGSAVQTLTLMLRYVASSKLPAPLYSVAVDMDVHPHLAAPTKVSPAATWCAKQHKLRWQLPQIGAGESGDLKVQFAAHVGEVALRSAGALAGVTAAAVQETVLRLRFVGPPQFSLSGTTLETGVDVASFEPAACAVFHGEITAQPELRLFDRVIPRVLAPRVVEEEEPSLMEM